MNAHDYGYWSGVDAERTRIVRLVNEQIARLSDQYAQRSDANVNVQFVHALQDLVEKIEKEAR